MENRRHHQESSGNGPSKMDGENIITVCIDCSRLDCPLRKANPWPTTTIAKDCPLPGVPERE